MKKLFAKSGFWFASMLMFVGSLTVNNACVGSYCQPKVPEKMGKNKLV